MPIYEYQCQECNHRLEALQTLSDPPLTTCTECGGELRKLLSAPAFQFKGSGWYVTDYARKGGGGNGSRETGSGSGEGAEGKKKSKGGKGSGKDSSAGSGGAKAGSAASGSGSDG